MTTKKSTRAPGSSRVEALSAAEIFPLLASDRRRHVLHLLSYHTRAVPIGEIAEQIALSEGNPTRDHYERILTGLHHSHLPKLVDGNLVHYDTERETVAALDTLESVRPYLDLAIVDDARTG